MNSKKIIGLLLTASMVMTAVASVFAAVTTDKTTKYYYGDSITIKRDETADAKLIITNPDGTIVLNDAMTGGKKSFTFKIPTDDKLGWTEGTYTVKTGEETTTFELAKKPVVTPTPIPTPTPTPTNGPGYNPGGGSGSSGGGSIAGGNVSGGGTAGIYKRPDKYEVNFQDLGEAAWAENAITFLAKKGIISGYNDTTFAPNASITRAEFAKLISSLYGLVSESSIFPSQSFTDVPKDAWYFNYVEVCSQLGIVGGYGDGTFNPNALISRQDMAVIIYRTASVMQNSLAAVNPAKTFADEADINDYAKSAISALQQAGLIDGTSETTFEPQAGCTRAQAATIMYNLYTKFAK